MGLKRLQVWASLNRMVEEQCNVLHGVLLPSLKDKSRNLHEIRGWGLESYANVCRRHLH